jgi:hypothetical protein
MSFLIDKARENNRPIKDKVTGIAYYPNVIKFPWCEYLNVLYVQSALPKYDIKKRIIQKLEEKELKYTSEGSFIYVEIPGQPHLMICCENRRVWMAPYKVGSIRDQEFPIKEEFTEELKQIVDMLICEAILFPPEHLKKLTPRYKPISKE